MTHIRLRYDFHPIGQGLFGTGALADYQSGRRFDWVFDCGTSSEIRFLENEIAGYTATLSGRPIKLFCLSHFDEDHVKGARALLEAQRVDTLVMPYFPLGERLLIALASPDLSDDYLRFLIDPAGFMYAAAGDNLGNIVLVTGGGAPTEEPEAPIPPDRPDDDDWDLHLPDTKVRETPAPEDIDGRMDQNSWRAVRVFTDEKPFTVGGFWEFMFFNEHIPDAKAEALREIVAETIRKFRKSDGSFDGKGLINELQVVYKQTFGSSGVAKNRISLVVYSGPIYRADLNAVYFSGGITSPGFSPPLWHRPYYRRRRTKVSLGYFGDFPLNSAVRLDAVRNHLGQRRWNWLEVIQVPHHGSSHSWYDGAGLQFQHDASVISAARQAKKHPSQLVMKDLDGRGIMLVNEIQGVTFTGHVHFG